MATLSGIRVEGASESLRIFTDGRVPKITYDPASNELLVTFPPTAAETGMRALDRDKLRVRHNLLNFPFGGTVRRYSQALLISDPLPYRRPGKRLKECPAVPQFSQFFDAQNRIRHT